jgi:hypothetical protein
MLAESISDQCFGVMRLRAWSFRAVTNAAAVTEFLVLSLLSPLLSTTPDRALNAERQREIETRTSSGRKKTLQLRTGCGWGKDRRPGNRPCDNSQGENWGEKGIGRPRYPNSTSTRTTFPALPELGVRFE